MLSVDTNVLVRLLARDDAKQAAAADIQAIDFNREAGAGERAVAGVAGQFFSSDLVRQLRCAGLKPFAQPEDRRASLALAQLPEGRAQAGYRRGGDDQTAANRLLDVRRRIHRDGNRYPRQELLVLARTADALRQPCFTRPQRHLMLGRKRDRERSAPRACPKDADLHGPLTSPRPGRWRRSRRRRRDASPWPSPRRALRPAPAPRPARP